MADAEEVQGGEDKRYLRKDFNDSKDKNEGSKTDPNSNE